MNHLYFACADCKIYIDAGYRWAYWQLEDAAVVTRTQPVNVDAVLAKETYWNPPNDENSKWLYQEILPPLREFLGDHVDHVILFGTSEDFAPDNDDYKFEWMQIGYLAAPKVRYLFEVLNLKTWDDVADYMAARKIRPAWWDDRWSSNPSPHEKGRRKFEGLVSSRTG